MNREQATALLKGICDHYHLDRSKIDSIKLTVDDTTQIVQIVEVHTTTGESFRLEHKDLISE